MSFTQFIKPYPDGYEDFEVGGTPVTAEILNTNYDGFLLGLNEFLPELAGMVEANPSESATAGNLTKLKVGNSIYLIPSGGSGGSTVEWEQLQLTGTKIATITIDNVPVDVYAPSGGGSGDEVSWNQVLGSGTEIGTITINGTPITVYAPTPIDVEANPSGSATAGDLTKLKVGNSIYSIPSGGSGGSGHTILDDDGTALSQEDDLQFKGVYSADNSEDGVTEVNVYREMTKAEFDLLSSDKKKGFIRVTDEPDIYSDGHFQPVIYSLEEREIGVWKDGRPLYEKTVDFGVLPNNTTKTVSYNISDLDYFVKIQCVAHNQNGSRNIPFVDDAYKSGDVLLDTIKSNGVIRIIAHTDLSSLTGEVTLQYVKSTDVAGSGSWTPQGVPTHKYSTEEHIVGTYLGETLYEKTIVVSALSIGENTINHLISGISEIIKVEGKSSYSGDCINMPYTSTVNGYVIGIQANATRILINVGASFNANDFSNISITLKYTKSS